MFTIFISDHEFKKKIITSILNQSLPYFQLIIVSCPSDFNNVNVKHRCGEEAGDHLPRPGETLQYWKDRTGKESHRHPDIQGGLAGEHFHHTQAIQAGYCVGAEAAEADGEAGGQHARERGGGQGDAAEAGRPPPHPQPSRSRKDPRQHRPPHPRQPQPGRLREDQECGCLGRLQSIQTKCHWRPWQI